MNQTSRLTFGRLALCALLLSAALLNSPVTLPARAAVNAVRYVAPPPIGSDSGDCIAVPCASIQQAIVQSFPGDAIIVAAGTYVENLQITKNLIVQGAGADATFIDGSDGGPVFYVSGTDINVTLAGLTIQHGNATASIYQYGGGIYYDGSGQLSVFASKIISNTALGGGGIFSTGHLTLGGVSVLGNHSTGSQGGGGLRVVGVADLINVNIANNTTSLGGGGGGIYNLGIMHLTYVTLANNEVSGSGGGLYNSGGTVTGTGGEIRDNRASYDGGGIYNTLPSAQLQLSAMTIKGNSVVAQGSGGGVSNNQGTASFNRVIFSGNSAEGGGGISNKAGGHLTIDNAWLKDNVARTAAGGGINNEGTLDVTASTLSGNTAAVLQGGGIRNVGSNATLTLVTLSGNTTPSSDGGAIYADGGLLNIVSSTIVSNTDPGLKTVASGSLSLVNSIVVDRSGGPNCVGTITSQGYNLEAKNTCNFNKPGDQVNQSNPGLGSLRDNGGPTPTHALAFSSPAMDKGNTDQAICQAKDQRGITRPSNGLCDVGAYELIGFGSNTTVLVPANGCVVSQQININDSYVIGKLNVGVNATFSPRGDLRVTLMSPGGTRVALLGPTGGAAVNLDALFDDAAPNGVPGSGTNNIGLPYYDNRYQPYEPLSVFNRVSTKGAWALEICSVTSATGALNRWLILVPEVTTSLTGYMPVMRR